MRSLASWAKKSSCSCCRGRPATALVPVGATTSSGGGGGRRGALAHAASAAVSRGRRFLGNGPTRPLRKRAWYRTGGHALHLDLVACERGLKRLAGSLYALDA